MRNIVDKTSTLRTATAEALVRIGPKTLHALRETGLPKGDPFPVAKIAAIQAAKDTPRLIPYCHSLTLESADVSFSIEHDEVVRVVATVSAIYKTGVEMEALTAVAVAALNLYDMMKPLDEEITIESIRLIEKRGGKSDFASRKHAVRGSVLVVSDSISAGNAKDHSGACLVDALDGFGVQAQLAVVADEAEQIANKVTEAVSKAIQLIVITGGTGVSPRDVTPEAVIPLLDKRLDGVEETMRAYGQARTPFAMLSRCVAGVRGQSVILCVPGSPQGALDAVRAVFPALLHVFEVLQGERHG